MWWSKQAQSTLSASHALRATGVMDAPIAAPLNQPAKTIPYPSIALGSDHIPRSNATPSDDLHLDATIEGSISLNCRRLTIGETAKATANVVAREVIVYGELTGRLHVADRIEIKKHASVMGDLTTPRILIEEGAYFKGTVQIDRRKRPRGTVPAPNLTAI